ncbi:lipid hydroperoxide peroxidase [Virgibacillus profundi]|uniref:Thiol peroxidase n=1 Tax=Virgibacillus profundi TaxID=2024555 RepID=A0A2A2IFK6_9BACI|nr:thiol peroxidase [Virgibacillus profundi]PAV30148.1 lipid hydroperoxide peroxidase [Virgibacillus profundi]PXY54320.1 thiol peroxidase [Virgibacillus profundi]
MANVTFQQEPVTLLGTELKVGDQAPDFTVLSNDLQEVSLADYKGKVKLISVVPSIDTGVCSEQTKRFNEEADKLGNVHVLTISMDLPFAQTRWCAANGIKKLDTLSDHRDADFGEKYGVLIKELRLLSRSIFVVDSNDKITYVEYVSEVTNHPDYDKVLHHIRQDILS